MAVPAGAVGAAGRKHPHQSCLLATGDGELTHDAVALDVALLLTFHASFLAGTIAPLWSWRAWPDLDL